LGRVGLPTARLAPAALAYGSPEFTHQSWAEDSVFPWPAQGCDRPI